MLCTWCRALSGIRLFGILFLSPRVSIPSRGYGTFRSFRQGRFTCRLAVVSDRRRFPFGIGLTATSTIPAVVQGSEQDIDDEQELTTEQELLQSSEAERRAHIYGVNKDSHLFYRFYRHLRTTFTRFLYEPIATCLRFIQLVAIFAPVFATVPIIFIGARNPEHDDERTGTLWWYRFLVKQMERAGATFIKVEFCFPY